MMALLSDTDRAAIRDEWMRDDTGEWGAVTKADLRAGVNALDGWVDTNKASANAALPAVLQAELTAAQKAQLLVHVVRKRFVKGA
jgi:hypothetical protein